MTDKRIDIDLGGCIFVICAFALIILCLGEPDLLDSIISRGAECRP